jgi:hypothetical protein
LEKRLAFLFLDDLQTSGCRRFEAEKPVLQGLVTRQLIHAPGMGDAAIVHHRDVIAERAHEM